MDCITLTFGDCAENHVGMQKLSNKPDSDIRLTPCIMGKIKEYVNQIGGTVIEYNLRSRPELPDASVSVIRNGVDLLTGPGSADALYRALNNMDPDKKALMYGRVRNKQARYNLCFSDFEQLPDYESGKGTVIDVEKIELLSRLRIGIMGLINCNNKNISEPSEILIEANYYQDIEKNGIGYHGDAERTYTIGARFGPNQPDLHYAWFHKSKYMGFGEKIKLNHGDIYIMSDKATGTDWRKKNIPTLRHATGADKFVKL